MEIIHGTAAGIIIVVANVGLNPTGINLQEIKLMAQFKASNYSEFYRLAFTGKQESWGCGMRETTNDASKLKKWLKIGTVVVAETGFDPKLLVNDTVTLTKITDADKLAAAKKEINWE